jgi:hypothetical protein
VKCLDAEKQIQESLDSGRRSVALDRHLQQCGSCALLAEDFEGVDALFRSARTLDPNPFLWTRIDSRLNAPPAAARRRRILWLEPAWLAAAFLLLFSIVIGTLHVPRSADAVLQGPPDVALPASVNPFVLAQARSVEMTNPFLEAMTPRDGNPFAVRREQ